MPDTNNPIARRTLIIFYVLDTSGSMQDDGKIGMLNETMRETIEVLKDVAKDNADAEMKIAVLKFDSGAEWVKKPTFLEDMYWEDLQANGLTDIGMALEELNVRLSREQFMTGKTGLYTPVIIFMTDGYPTDDWSKALNKIKSENKWFKAATKIGFALGADADHKTIASIVGNSEAVVQTEDLEVFKKLIRFVSVRSSILNGTSKMAGSESSGSDIVKAALEEQNLDGAYIPQSNIQDNEPEPEVDVVGDSEWDTSGW
jgi:uncharacterized protein YegL